MGARGTRPYNYGHELGVSDWEKNQKLLSEPASRSLCGFSAFNVQKSDPQCEFVKTHQYQEKIKLHLLNVTITISTNQGLLHCN